MQDNENMDTHTDAHTTPADSNSGLRPEIREAICDMGYEDAVLLDGYDGAIIGVTTDGAAVYDYEQMISCLIAQDDMTYEDAVEWIDYNTIRALPYAPEPRPIIMYHLMV